MVHTITEPTPVSSFDFDRSIFERLNLKAGACSQPAWKLVNCLAAYGDVILFKSPPARTADRWVSESA